MRCLNQWVASRQAMPPGEFITVIYTNFKAINMMTIIIIAAAVNLN